MARARANELGLGDDLFIQGSRAKGTARPDSDIDIAIRISPEQFDDFLFNRNYSASFSGKLAQLPRQPPPSKLSKSAINQHASGNLPPSLARKKQLQVIQQR
ncbi:nucleotidyltransferase family protein [Microbulbifer sp. SSSA002]|uniref:nucleotidyltransferase family protein n=1 Tax=Microbulbifer sp. SSSA002 TaxID=3243376 RepID=UPI004039D0E2